MGSFNWHRLATYFTKSKVQPRSRRPRWRPLLEELEDRLAPSLFTWTGAGGSPNWSTPSNWAGGAAPTGAAMEDLVFPAGITNKITVNNLNNAVFRSITFSGTGYTLSGSPITLVNPADSSSGNIIVNSGAAGQIVSFDINLGGGANNRQFFIVNAGGDLTLSGRLSGDASVELAKSGQGRLVLAADNSAFNGPITLENNGGIVEVRHHNALGDTTAGTTVGAGAQLQVSNVAVPILEPLILNGLGGDNTGALLNLSGNNQWGGNIQLDVGTPAVAIGSAGGSLNVSGQVSDLGAGQNLIKEGTGEVILSHLTGNTYRGQTIINEGTLTIQHPLALGLGGTALSGTIVNRSITQTGMLQIDDPTGVGFTVFNEHLTLNGPGIGNQGALANVRGNNTWAGSVLLGSPPPAGSSVTIGIAPPSSLTISGVVSSPQGSFALTKVGSGTLILNNANTYTGSTLVSQGILNIRDSRALGAGGGAVTVAAGATLQLEVDTGFDAHGRDLSNDSITGQTGNGPQLGLRVNRILNLNGSGINGIGALHSLSGINEWVGNINLSGSAAIGVDPDPNQSNTNLYFTNDYKLTVKGNLGGNSLIKVGTGQMVLPSSNNYTGTTNIQQGWITVQDNFSLGGFQNNLLTSNFNQPATTVQAGAALHLKPETPGADFNFVKNLILSGTGIQHDFPLINEKGALMSLGGNNTVGGPAGPISSYIRLNGVAGIGVELLGPDTTSSLTLTHTIQDNPGTTGGGITKFGSQRLIMLADGLYTGPVNIREGVMLVRNDTALGTATSGTVNGPQAYTTTTTTVGRGNSEVQTVTVTGATGSFTLTFNGVTTPALPFNATAGQVQAALNALPTISGPGGTVSVNQAGNIYSITFGGTFVGFNQPQLTANGSGGTFVAVNTILNGDGTAMELESGHPFYHAGVSSGLQIWNENLVLNSPGNATFGLAPLSVRSNDHLWRGQISLESSSTIQVPASARLTLFGTISDTNNPSPSGSDLIFQGGGELGLAGTNTYRGTTFVDQGLLVVRNSQALGGTGISEVQTVSLANANPFTLTFNGETTTVLNGGSATLAADMQSALNALPTIGGAGGSVTVVRGFPPNQNLFTITFAGNLFGFNQPQITGQETGGTPLEVATVRNGAGGTIVADGAALELQGNLVISGEPLILHGRGATETSFVPERWFAEGPSPVNSWPGAGEQSVAGRVTGVVVDPVDSNIIYVTTAGGGAWKTRNSGHTWEPLFDMRNGSLEVQQFTVAPGIPFTLSFNGASTPSLRFNALAGIDLPELEAAGTADPVVLTVEDGSDTTVETQEVTLTAGGPTSFTLTFEGETTLPLDFNATAVEVQAALNALPSIGGVGGFVNVTRNINTFTITFPGRNLEGLQAELNALPTIGGVGGYVSLYKEGNVYTATFLGTLAGLDVPAMTGAGVQTISDGTGVTVEQQLVKVEGPPGGSFTLNFNGVNTDPLIPSSLAGLNQPQMTAAGAGGAAVTVSTISNGSPTTLEVQRVLVTGGAGTFTLTFGGQTTAALAFDATPAQVQAALNGLTSIGGAGGVVSVTMGPNGLGDYIVTFTGVNAAGIEAALNALPTIAGVRGFVNVVPVAGQTNTYKVYFLGSFVGQNQPRMTASASFGTTVSITAVADGRGIVRETQTINVSGSSGNITVSFNGETTDELPFNPTNSQLEAALNALPSIGGAGGFVTVERPSGFTVVFTGSLSGINVDQMTATGISGTTASVVTLLDGARTNERQEITILGTAGTFQLFFGFEATANLNWDASAAQVQTALNNLTSIQDGPGSIGGGSVSVTKAGNVFTIDFTGSWSEVNANQISGQGTGGATVLWDTLIQGGQLINNEAQMVIVEGASGSFSLTFNGETTAQLPVNATAIQIRNALNSLATIGGVGGFVNVTPPPNVYSISFDGSLRGLDLPLMTGEGTGGASVAVDPVRDGYGIVMDVQALNVTGTEGTFTLTFHGATTKPLPVNATALQVQHALNALPTIGGKDTSVTVTQTGTIYKITFHGNLTPESLTPLTAEGFDGAEAVVDTVWHGIALDEPMYVGTIAIDPANRNIIYIGTGETNNSPDSFYGTGVYRSTDAGKTWALVTDSMGANPLHGTGIAKIIVDRGPVQPFFAQPIVYVAAQDGGPGRNEVQTVWIDLPFPSNFQLIFTGRNAQGNIVTLNTANIDYTLDNVLLAQRIRNALNALPNIGGIGGRVTVDPPEGIGFFDRYFTVTFEGALSQVDVLQLQSNRSTFFIDIETVQDGKGPGVINGSEGGGGIWRLESGQWFNMTSVVSANRQSVASTQPNFPTNGASPYVNPPRTPGPDDNYLVNFPQTNAVWSDIALIYTDITNRPDNQPPPPLSQRQPVLYAALGNASGDLNNGVFWSRNPRSNAPIWYVGQPGGTHARPATDPTGVDARSAGQFPVGQFPIPNPAPGVPAIPLNGNIKLAAFQGTYLVTSTVYASVVSPNRTLRAMYKTTNGGHTWAAVNVPTFVSSHGDYANVLMTALNANTIYAAGHEIDNTTHLQQIFRSTDGGTSWTDLSVDVNGNGPRTAIHTLARDSSNRILAGTDGGLWRLNTNNTWTNLNGNLTVSQINSVASHPTDLSITYAGIQSNGTAMFTNDLAWETVDGHGGGTVRIDPMNPNNIFHVMLQFGANALIRRSTNGGQTWTTVLSTNNTTVPLALDKVNSSRLVVGGNPLQESLNQGSTWTNLQAPSALGVVSALGLATFQGPFIPDAGFPLVVDKGSSTYDPDTIYVTNGNVVWVTKNRGQSWSNRTSNLAGLGNIVDLVVDPRNRDTVFAVRSTFGEGKVFQTTNAGGSWTDITHDLPDLPVWKLVIDPRNGNFYIGTDRGVWMLEAGTTSWRQLGSGLPNVQVRDLELNLTTNTLLAGTYGRGVYRLFLDDGAANAGVLRAVSGSAVWAGNIQLVGDSTDNTVVISAGGTQTLQTNVAIAQLNILGRISDRTAGSSPTLVKMGHGNVILSGANTYGGLTDIQEGALVVRNSQALGSADEKTIVNDGTVLVLESDLASETIELHGDGVLFNDHWTGALRNVSGNNTFTGTITLVTDSTIGVNSGTSLTIGTKDGLPGTGTIIDNGMDRQLSKELTGTLVLASENDFGGTTLVNQGVLRIEHPLALGRTDNGVDVLDGAQIQLRTPTTGPLANQPVVVVDQHLTLSGTGINSTGALLNTFGNNAWQGQVTLQSNPFLRIPSGIPATVPPNFISVGTSRFADTLTIDGPIDQSGGSFGLDKVGLGRVVLTSANTYSGVTHVRDGVLNIQHGDALGLDQVFVSPLIRDYQLNGTFADALGGPSLVPHPNGILTASNYQFGPNEGLTLTGALPDPTHYSIEMVFNIANTSSWRNLIEFKNRQADTGLYNFGSALQFYNEVTGPAGAFSPNVDVHLVLTRNNLTNEVVGYINGVQHISFIDSSSLATFDGPSNPNNIIHFFIDDLIVSGEASAGVVDMIRIYNIPLTSAQVVDVFNGGTVTIPVLQQGTIVHAGAALELEHATGITVPDETLTLNSHGTPEVQTVTVTGAVGTFTLNFNGPTTPPLPFNASAAQVQNALNSLSTIGGVGGQVTVIKEGNVFTVVFKGVSTLGTLAGINVPELIAEGADGTTAMVTTFQDGGLGALRNIGGDNTWNGTVLLQTNNSVGVNPNTELTISGLIRDPSPASVPAASLTKVGTGTLALPSANAYSGKTFVNEGILNISHGAALGISGPEQQRVTVLGSSGTFTLNFNGATTIALDILSPTLAADMEAALNALPTIGGIGGSVAVTQGGSTATNVFTVIFGDSLAFSNLPQMTAQVSPGVTVVVSTLLDGPEGTTVADGATLQVQGDIHVANETLILNGQGVGGNGALESVNGDNTWSGPVTLASDVFLGVQTGSTLAINQAIIQSGANRGVTKVGPGLLEYTGDTDNTYTGLTRIVDGTLVLNKDGATALSGNLIIGENLGNNALAEWAASDQIVNTATVTVNADGELDLNSHAEFIGSLIINDGLASLTTGTLTVGALTMTGGIVNLANAASSLVLNGNVTASSGLMTGPANILGSGTLDLSDDERIFTVSNGTLHVNVPFSGHDDDSLVKNGGGLLLLDLDANYPGPSTIQAGILQVRSQVGDIILDGGTLAGIGTVGDITATNNGQAISPGTSPGILTSDGDVVLNSSVAFVVELNNTLPGAGHDQLVVNGDINLNGASLQVIDGLDIDLGDRFTIITATGTLSGEFQQGEAIFVDGRKYRIEYDYDANQVILERVKSDVIVSLSSSANPSVYGQDFTITATVTPEPGANPVQAGTVTVTLVNSADPGNELLNEILTLTFENGMGQATFNPQGIIGTALAVGTYEIRASFPETSEFLSAEGDFVQAVEEAPTSVVLNSNVAQPVFGQPVTITVTVSPVIPGGAVPGTTPLTGTVDIFLNNLLLAEAVTLNGDGQASITLPTNGLYPVLSVGQHTFRASYGGDSSYVAASSTSDLSLEVAKANTTVTVSSPPGTSVIGDSVTFTVIVSAAPPGAGDPSGTVRFFDGAILLGSVPVNPANGEASITVSTLGVGSHNIIVSYLGDNNFNGSSTSFPHTVDKRDTTTTLTASPSDQTGLGQQVTFIATVASVGTGPTAITGTITFNINDGEIIQNVSLVGGQASFAISTLSVGQHSVVATYSGNTTYNSSIDTLTQTVAHGLTTTTISASQSAAELGEPVTFTATVAAVPPAPGTPTGAIRFQFGTGPDAVIADVNLDGNQAQFTIDSLPPGLHPVTATYLGDSNFAVSSAALDPDFRVFGVPTTTTVSSSADTIVFGDSVTFTAIVNAEAGGTPTGTVTFQVGNQTYDDIPLIGNQAELTLNDLGGGTYIVTAIYSGDENFDPSSDTLSPDLVVLPAETTTAVDSSLPSIIFGQSVTITATVNADPGLGTPTGTVTFQVGNQTYNDIPLVGNQAELILNDLDANTYTITATYSGNANFAASIGTLNPDLIVAPAPTTTILSTTNSNAVYGQPTITATVAVVSPGTGTPTGTVSFQINDGSGITTVEVSLVNGVATLPTLDVGSYSITATYNGVTNYAGSNSNSISQTINQASTTTTLNTTNDDAAFGEAVITATVAAVAPANGVPTGFVTFAIDDGGSVTNVQVSLIDGVATLPDLSVGTYSITATYDGTVNFSTSSDGPISQIIQQVNTTTVLNTTNAVAVYGEAVITATVTSSNFTGEITGFVTFEVNNGSSITSMDIPLINGVATLPNLDVGTYFITAIFTGDINHQASSDGPITQTINQASTTTTLTTTKANAVYGEAIITATVASVSPGLGIPEGTVTFFINGNPTSPVSLVNGVATLPTTLDPGTYTISASFAGDTNYAGSNGGPFVQIVNKAGATVSVGSSSNPSIFGQSVTFTVTVTATAPGSGLPTGTVNFQVGNQTFNNVPLNGSGQAEVSVSNLAVGTHAITVSYSGDSNFLSGNGSLSPSQTVDQANTTTVLNTTNANSVFGQATITATVSSVGPGSGTPTGTVTFFLNGNPTQPVTLVNGVATLPPLAPGNYTITATYNGDANFLSSNGTLASGQIVSPASTAVTISTSANPSVFGQSVTFTATVSAVLPGSGIPSGSVTFQIGSQTFNNVPLNGSGQAEVSVSNLAVGTHAVTVTYSGDGNFLDSNATLSPSQTVDQADTSVAVVSSLPTSFVGQTVTFTATVSVLSPGSGTATGFVRFQVGSFDVQQPLVGNQAAFSTNQLPVGSHPVTVTYLGNGNFNASQPASITQEVEVAPTITTVMPSSIPTGNVFEARVEFRDSSGNINTAFNSNVTLSLNGGPAGGTLGGTLTVTAVNGVARFTNLTLNVAGLYLLQAQIQGMSPLPLPSIMGTANRLVPTFPNALYATQAFNFTVDALDSTNQLDPNFNQVASVSLVSGPTGATLTGTLTRSLVGGKATFNLTVNTPGSYMLRLASGNLVTLIKFNALTSPGRRVPLATDSSNFEFIYMAGPLSPADQDQLSQLRIQYGFYSTGNMYLNFLGLNEKWFLSRENNTTWYVIKPTGEIHRWLGGSNLGAAIATINGTTINGVTINSIVWDNPNLLFQAPVSLTQAEQDQLSQLRETHGFHSTGNFYQNFLGLNEKWFQNRTGSWFVLTPSGQIRQWLGGTSLSGIIPNGVVTPLVWDNPNLLFQAKLNISAGDQAQLEQLGLDRGFYFSGSFHQNFLGLNEKWIRDRFNNWFVIRTDGRIQQWLGGSNLATPIATVNPLVWDDPYLLLRASLSSAAQTQLTDLRQEYGFRFGGNFYHNFLGLNEKWFIDRNNVWFVIRTDGRIQQWLGGSSVGTAIATVDPLVWTDPNLLFLA